MVSSGKSARIAPGRATPARIARARVARLHLIAWALGKVFALAILGGSIWALLTFLGDSRFQVRHLAIQGAGLVSPEEIEQQLGLDGTNVFFIRSSLYERRLRLNPAIERARVESRLLDTVRVKVEERTPAAVWDDGTVPALVDGTGLVIGAGAPDQTSGLPRIQAPEGPTVRISDRLDPAPVRVAEAVFARLDSLGLAGARLEYRPASGVTILGSYRVAVGSDDHIDAKLAAYQAIRRHLEQSRTRAEFIDVRFLDRPYFR